jgi:hypothetical protein
MTTLFNEWDDTSFSNSTVHSVVMYAITVRACANQYLAPIFKRNKESSIEHGVLETMSTQSILSMHSVNIYVHTTISIIETLYFFKRCPSSYETKVRTRSKRSKKTGVKMMHGYCLRLTWHITVSPQISAIEPFITFIFIN